MTDQQNQSIFVAPNAHTININTSDFLSAELLATLSHELRSPLASIRDYTTTLLRFSEKMSPEECLEFLQAINEGSDRLARSIDRMIELAQIESGVFTLQPTWNNVIQLIQNVIAKITRLHPLQPPRTIRVRQETYQGMPLEQDLIIWSDRHGLSTVIENLLVIDDISHHSPDNQPIDIIVTPICTEEDRRHLPEGVRSAANLDMTLIRVQDHGLGIPQDQLKQIFCRLQRRDVFTHGTGLGLGLTLCYHIIALHHGNIWTESETGGGSIFYILLPTEPPEQEADVR